MELLRCGWQQSGSKETCYCRTDLTNCIFIILNWRSAWRYYYHLVWMKTLASNILVDFGHSALLIFSLHRMIGNPIRKCVELKREQNPQYFGVNFLFLNLDNCISPCTEAFYRVLWFLIVIL